MILGDSIAERKIRQYTVQVRPREDPEATEWVPSNEDKVDSAQFFIDKPLPTGNYALLQLRTTGAAFLTHSITVGICGATTKKTRPGARRR